MLLDEIKSLIKECEECLIKDTRFKKDYEFKSQVRTIYKHDKNIQTRQIIIPVPYYSGNNTNKESNHREEQRCGVCEKCLKGERCEIYDKGRINPFKIEGQELHNLVDITLEPIQKDNVYSENEIKEIDNLNLGVVDLRNLLAELGLPENKGKFDEIIKKYKK